MHFCIMPLLLLLHSTQTSRLGCLFFIFIYLTRLHLRHVLKTIKGNGVVYRIPWNWEVIAPVNLYEQVSLFPKEYKKVPLLSGFTYVCTRSSIFFPGLLTSLGIVMLFFCFFLLACLVIQAKMYEAFFSEFLSQEWSLGVILWHWELEPWAGKKHPSRKWYTPQHKPAQKILTKFFRKYC